MRIYDQPLFYSWFRHLMFPFCHQWLYYARPTCKQRTMSNINHMTFASFRKPTCNIWLRPALQIDKAKNTRQWCVSRRRILAVNMIYLLVELVGQSLNWKTPSCQCSFAFWPSYSHTRTRQICWSGEEGKIWSCRL